MTVELSGYGPIDTVICDIDGVVVLGNEAVPGAGAALEQLRSAGLRVLFATNNSTKTTAAVAHKLTDIVGYDPGVENVVTSGAATGRYLAGRVEAVYVLGADGLRDTLRAAGINVVKDWREADSVVAGLDFNVTYDALVGATLAVQKGAAFYATNGDVTYPTSEGQYPGAGSLWAVVETATGVSPEVCGKPFAPMSAMLSEYAGEHPLIVGDRPDTDLAIGKVEGWATALVLTGVTAAAQDVPDQYTPDLVLDSIVDLPIALGLR